LNSLASRMPLEYRLAWARDPNCGCLAFVAGERGIGTRMVSFRRRWKDPLTPWLEMRIGRRLYMVRRAAIIYRENVPFSRWRHVNGKTVHVTSDKAASARILRAAGCSVAPFRSFRPTEREEARAYFESTGTEACLKPVHGWAGLNVFPAIRDRSEFDRAFDVIAASGDDVFVERHLTGDIVRFIFVGGRLVGTRIVRPCAVTGDGRSTVAELIAAENAWILQRDVPSWGTIAVPLQEPAVLERQGLGLSSVPAAGRRVPLSLVSNVSKGGRSIGEPPDVHPSYALEAKRAADAFPGLAITALDVMVADYGKPAAADNHWILDVNSAPGIATFHFVHEGRPAEVADAVMDWLLAGGPTRRTGSEMTP